MSGTYGGAGSPCIMNGNQMGGVRLEGLGTETSGAVARHVWAFAVGLLLAAC
jgi:hypothetical protein